MPISRIILPILVLSSLSACTRDLPMSVDSPRNHEADEKFFTGPSPTLKITASPEMDPHYVAGSRKGEEERATSRLAALVPPSFLKDLLAALDPKSKTSIMVSGGETAQLYQTIATIRRADVAAAAREKSRAVARTRTLVVHVALVSPAVLGEARVRVLRDPLLHPSELILLRRDAMPQDLAAGIAGMYELRRLFGDELTNRVYSDVPSVPSGLTPSASQQADQILRRAAAAVPEAIEGYGEAQMSVVRLAPVHGR